MHHHFHLKKRCPTFVRAQLCQVPGHAHFLSPMVAVPHITGNRQAFFEMNKIVMLPSQPLLVDGGGFMVDVRFVEV